VRVTFRSPPLAHILEKLRGHYEAAQRKDWLVVPYVLTCAAYLEAKLNDTLFEFSLEKYGEEVATILVTLPLPRKLITVVPVLTEGRYSINKEHIVYQRLASLIRVRNSVAHAKSEFEELTHGDGDLVAVIRPGEPPVKIPGLFKPSEKSSDLTLGASKPFTPHEYHGALKTFEKAFFARCPDRLKKVAMVVERPKGQWTTERTALIKFLD